MAVTAGALTLLSVSDTTASLQSAAATAGTGPYTYQWYRSTVSGFSPGGGNIIAGATSLVLNDSGLTPGTQYYYKVVATDTGASNATSTSSQLAVLTLAQALKANVFGMGPCLGMADQRMNPNTTEVQIDVSQSGVLYAGQAVKIVDSAGGIPKVVACSANADQVFGFIIFDTKSQGYRAQDRCEIAQSGDVLYLYATGAISRGVQVTLDVVTIGGVGAAVGSSGARLVGWAFDKAAAAGQLIRVKVNCPSFSVA